MGLQNAFYIIGIIYMAFMFLVTVTILIVLLVVKSKISRLQRKIQHKMDIARDASAGVLTFVRVFRSMMKNNRYDDRKSG